jgi:hypothetical protein
MNSKEKLTLIKIAHTIIWAIFALAIFSIPVFTSLGNIKISTALIFFVMIEVFILTLNKFKCPLTVIAARYTSERQENFDIYLPLWLAKYNKSIFGTLFILGCIYTLYSW